METFDSIIKNPSTNKRLWALWIWNKTITEDALIAQVHGFIEQGFGGIIVRPSRDMIPQYMSEEFILFFEKVLSIAKEHSIKIRIGDDFSIPWSGCLQSVAERNPSFRAQKLELQSYKILDGGEPFPETYNDPENIIVLAAPLNGELLDTSVVEILYSGKKNLLESWAAPSGRWQVMVYKKVWYSDVLGNYVPNLFNPKMAQAYIHNVLEELIERFKKFVPTTFEGFVNEISSYLPGNNSIPWDDDLIVKYKSRYKKNLIKVIPNLFFNVDDSLVKNRSHVYNFIMQAMYERYPAVLEIWAQKNKFSQWVLSAEDDINNGSHTLKDVMAVTTSEIAHSGIQTQNGTENQASSVKATADINRVEFYRNTIGVIGRSRVGTGASLQSLKNEIDLHAFNGTTDIILDGCFFNLDQRSYLKSPFNHNWYHPEWSYLKDLNEYTRRIMSLAKEMPKKSRVAVVIPSHSSMADYKPSDDSAFRHAMEIFDNTVEDLKSLCVEFDIVREQFLLGCDVTRDGRFGINEKQGYYECLIFPFARLINNSTFVFLEKLAVKKGVILFLNEAPQGSFDDGQNPSFTARVTKLTKPKNRNVHVVSPHNLPSYLSSVRRAEKVTINGKDSTDIHITSTYSDDENLYLIRNNSNTTEHYTTFTLPKPESITYGEFAKPVVHSLDFSFNDDDMAVLEFNIGPKETVALSIVPLKEGDDFSNEDFDDSSSENQNDDTNDDNDDDNDDEDPVAVSLVESRNYCVVLKKDWEFTPESYNVLPLAAWNTKIGLNRDVGSYLHFYETNCEALYVPETAVLCFPGMLREMMENQSKIKSFDIAVNGHTLSLMNHDEPSTYTIIKNNGEGDIVYRVDTDYLGSNCLKFNISRYLKKGINRIAVRAMALVEDPLAMNYPPVIAGSFSIAKGAKGWQIRENNNEVTYGSWTEVGYPYMVGTGRYEQDFEIPEGYEHVSLRFSNVSGTIDVKLNGTPLGVKSWHPYVFDITNAVQEHRNKLTFTVTNTPDNLLRMNGRDSGLIGEVMIDVFSSN